MPGTLALLRSSSRLRSGRARAGLKPHLNFVALLVGCTAAAVLGDQVGYTIGTRGGTRLAQHGDGRLFRRRHVERTQAFFGRHGAKTIVLARFVPVVRTFAPVLAGVGGMRRRTFTLFNVIGAVLWVCGVTLLGYFLGTTLGASVDTYLIPIIAFVVVISLLPPLIDWRRSAARAKRAESEDE